MNGVKWERAQCTAGSTVSRNFCSGISSEVCTSYIHACVPSASGPHIQHRARARWERVNCRLRIATVPVSEGGGEN